MRAISGTSRPSSSTCAFQSLKPPSSSSSSWPRRSSRTGCADSGLTRYWYQERSQATVTASSPAVPESGTMLAFASPRLFAMPPTVRRYALALKRSAASSSATSPSERRRRIGSCCASASSSLVRERPNMPVRPCFRRRRPLLDPAVLERDLLAERADVDELGAFVGREPGGPLSHQQRALAHGARA